MEAVQHLHRYCTAGMAAEKGNVVIYPITSFTTKFCCICLSIYLIAPDI